MSLLKTSNPAFTPYFWKDNQVSSRKMTVSGIVIKTLTMLFITTTITVLIWKMYSHGTNIKWFGTGYFSHFSVLRFHSLYVNVSAEDKAWAATLGKALKQSGTLQL